MALVPPSPFQWLAVELHIPADSETSLTLGQAESSHPYITTLVTPARSSAFLNICSVPLLRSFLVTTTGMSHAGIQLRVSRG